MLTVPLILRTQFDEYLRDKAIPSHIHGAFHKWLRYYPDFCHKYHFPSEQHERLPFFLQKLRQKQQTQPQQEQAAQAVAVYYELLEGTVGKKAQKLAEHSLQKESYGNRPNLEQAHVQKTQGPSTQEVCQVPPAPASPPAPRRVLSGRGADGEGQTQTLCADGPLPTGDRYSFAALSDSLRSGGARDACTEGDR